MKKRIARAGWLLTNAKAVIALSEFQASVIRKEYPVLDIKTISLGSFYKRDNSKPKRYSTRSPIIFGFMGSLEPRKGVHLLIQAFRKIQSPRSRLKIYGCPHRGKDSSFNPYFTELLGLAMGDKRIEFHGPYSTREEIAKILESIDVLCFPSIWFETFGLVVEEALSAAVPVIASKIGAIPERIQEGVNGWLVNPGDIDGWHRAMQKVVKGSPLLNSLRENINRFMSVEEEALEYENLYREIVRNGKSLFSN